jgi:hypothetical protein
MWIDCSLVPFALPLFTLHPAFRIPCRLLSNHQKRFVEAYKFAFLKYGPEIVNSIVMFSKELFWLVISITKRKFPHTVREPWSSWTAWICEEPTMECWWKSSSFSRYHLWLSYRLDTETVCRWFEDLATQVVNIKFLDSRVKIMMLIIHILQLWTSFASCS